MIRITKNTDIKFSLSDVAGIYEDNFTLSFYTTNANIYKQYTQADVTDGYISITWKGIVMIGGGVLNYICVNHIPDTTFPDKTNDKSFVGTTDYYIVNEDDGTSAIYDVINDEIDARKKADETLQSEIDLKANKDDVYTKSEVDDKIDNINLTNYYTKSESDTKYATNTALSDLADNVGDLQNTKADKTELDNYLPLSGGTMNSAATVKFVEDNKYGGNTLTRRNIDLLAASTDGSCYFDNLVNSSGLDIKVADNESFTKADRTYLQQYAKNSYFNQTVYHTDKTHASQKNTTVDREKVTDNIIFQKDDGTGYANCLKQVNTNGFTDNNIFNINSSDGTRFGYSNIGRDTYTTLSQYYYLKNAKQLGVANQVSENTAIGIYSTDKDKLAIGVLDKTNNKVGINICNITDDEQYGIYIDGKTTNDIPTANGGVKTIGTDIASQSDLTAIKTDVATNTTNIANKANTSDLNALKTSVEGSITNLTTTVSNKANSDDVYTKTEIDTMVGDVESVLKSINGGE